MKSILLLLVPLLTFMVPFQSPGQIPNGDFEQWSSGNPVGWLTDNRPGTTPVTQSSDKHSGNFALRGEVVSTGLPFNAPWIQAGTEGKGIPISHAYAALQGYCVFNPIGGDVFAILVAFKSNGALIALGEYSDTLGIASYTQFTINMEYFMTAVPDTALIDVLIYGPTGIDYHIGSYMLLDDFEFSGTVSVDDDRNALPVEYRLLENYPNPFNPATTISFALPRLSIVTVDVYDVLGQKVLTLLDRQKMDAGLRQVRFDASGLPSGVYYYRLSADGFLNKGEMRNQQFSGVGKMLYIR